MLSMIRSPLCFVLVLFAAVLAGITVGIAQSPSETRNRSENDREARIVERTRAALDGKPVESIGDPIADGLLDFAREQGSILKGSVLDPDLNQPQGQQPSTDRQRARIAELLLKSSRMLETVPGDDSRRELVARMRKEAVKLLSGD